ncbi:MAG: FeoA domain-containing protein [Promethearchaeia archaeon]
MNLLEVEEGKELTIKEVTAGFLTKRNLEDKGIQEGAKIKKLTEVGDAVKIQNEAGDEVWIGSEDVGEIHL